jgi:hypothetical protein
MNSTVTLEPGIYIMYEGPFNLQAGSVVNGDEVMLAFVGEAATLYMIGDATMHLTSPVSGTYKNIQFFGDRDIYAGPNGKASNLWFTVIGGSVLTYDGVLYAPTFHVWFAGNSTIEASSPNYLAVAKKLWFQDQTSVKMEHANKRNLDDVEEAKYLEKSARLIQ